MAIKLCEDCREFNKAELGKPSYVSKGESGLRKSTRVEFKPAFRPDAPGSPVSVDGFPYKLPLKIDDDGLTIVDATGIVVVPCVAYRGDLVHVEIQKKAVEYIVARLNA